MTTDCEGRIGRCVIFGGTGFIGSHLARFLFENDLADEIVLADIAPMRADFSLPSNRVRHVEVDVRQSPDSWLLPTRVDLIANFAAIHREPGHQLREYYETNLPGAENVCAWAEQVDCQQLIFTSSIAPYGPTETLKTEASIPTPTSAYGGSKLAAEKIHIAWQRAATGRKLVIVRPGVVFGPGEGGNVTRLVRATIGRYFFYMGNRQTRKAGGYVKELVRSMRWALQQLPAQGGVYLYNFSMPEAPTVEDYVQMVCRVAKVSRRVLSLPYPILLGAAYLLDGVARLLRVSQPVSPVRIRKLVRSNNIRPSVLLANDYPFQYTFEAAMRDWYADRPGDWT